MVKWQPTDEDIVIGVNRHRFAHGSNIGKQVGVTEYDAFRISGAPRGILEKSDIVGGAGG